MNSDAATRVLLRFRRAFAREPITKSGTLLKSSERNGVHPSKTEFLQLVLWKVAQIPCQDERCLGGDCRCDDMPIIRIGQGYRRDVLLVAADHCRGERVIHQPPGDLQALDRNCWHVGR